MKVVGEQMNKLKVGQLMFKLPIFALVVMTQTISMAQSTATSTAAGTSTTTAESLKPKTNKFSFTYANATTNNFFDAKTKGGAATINVLSLGYKYSDNWSYAFTMTNDYTIPSREDVKNDNAAYRDAYLSASTTHGSFLGTEKTPVKYKLGLPTTTASKDAKQLFIAAADISLNYDLASKLTAGALLRPYLYIRNGADQYRHILESEIRYSYTPKVSNYVGFNHDVRGLAHSNLVKTLEAVSLLVGVGYNPTKDIALQFSVERDRYLYGSPTNPDQRNKTEEFKFLDEKEISYLAEASVTF